MNKYLDIDLSAFIALRADLGEDFVKEMVDTFIDDSRHQAAILQEGLAENHQADFIRAAHTLKSTSLIFGARNFSELARELEQIGREGHLEGSGEKVKCLNDSLIGLHELLRGLCHG